jgi:PAS domain S-box-containing protein
MQNGIDSRATHPLPAGPPPPRASGEHPFGAPAFLAAIVESCDDSIIGTDMSGTIVSWNRGAQRMFGYLPEEIIGRHITTLFLPEQRNEYVGVLVRTQNGERIDRYEALRVAKDGTAIPVSVILSPVKDSSGRLIGVSAIYRDITLRKLRYEQLARAKDAAEVANRAKSEFLANMSHEIRTPMNGILGMTDVLLGTDLSAEQNDYVEIIRLSATSLLAIINDILDFSKIEANRIEIVREDLHVETLVRSVVRELNILAEQKGLTLTFVLHPGVPATLSGDPVRLRQVLINLAGNAIKFTDRGKVEIGVEALPGPATRFSVRDTGPGVPPEKRVKIFEAFTQLDGASTRKAGGTGLGLAIAARLVELMGGTIGVESDGHSGSTFFFTVPG